MTKLACFDLWETLVTEPSTFEDCWEPFAKAYPDKIDWKTIKTLIAQIAQKKDQSTKESTKEILGHFGVTNDSLILEISKRWEESCDQVKLFPETINALEDIKAAGFKLGLITNTSRYGWEMINKKLSLGNYFDYLALSFECNHVKPELEIFELVENKSGLFGIEIVMIGDSYKSDFEAPRQRGWKSILLDRTGTKEYPDAKPVVQNLLQIKNFL